MQTDDLQDLLIIEQMNSFSPWTSSQFTEAHNYIYVLLCESVVIGFAALTQSYDQAELQNFSIHRDYQNLGYGKRLLDFAFQHLSRDVKTIFLEVRVSNFTAIRLYHNLGFEEIGNRRDYYQTEFGREDALIMSVDINGS
jgi:ribosomal-protein-alanine N-acetyltransferase